MICWNLAEGFQFSFTLMWFWWRYQWERITEIRKITPIVFLDHYIYISRISLSKLTVILKHFSTNSLSKLKNWINVPIPWIARRNEWKNFKINKCRPIKLLNDICGAKTVKQANCETRELSNARIDKWQAVKFRNCQTCKV